MSNNDSPTISVIIPAYNTSQYIAEALDSVFAQTFSDFEVIVINDGSPDTEALERALLPFRDKIQYLWQENSGVAAARNAGIRIARGQYLAMLDSDDIWLPQYLEKQLAAITSSPDIAVSYTNARYFGDSPLSGKDFMSYFPSEGEVTFQSMIEEKVHVVGTSMALREAVVEVGLYDETLATSEDFDLWLRVAHAGWRIVYTREELFLYRRRGGCLSEDQIGFWASFLRAMEKIERSMPLTPYQREIVEDRCSFIRANLALYTGKQAFFDGDAEKAIELLASANAYFKSAKLSIALRLLRLAPKLMLGLYDARDRFLFGRNTRGA